MIEELSLFHPILHLCKSLLALELTIHIADAEIIRIDVLISHTDLICTAKCLEILNVAACNLLAGCYAIFYILANIIFNAVMLINIKITIGCEILVAFSSSTEVFFEEYIMTENSGNSLIEVTCSLEIVILVEQHLQEARCHHLVIFFFC